MKAALERCHDSMMEKCKADALQGTEAIFGKALNAEMRKSYPKLSEQKSLQETGATQYIEDRSTGYHDAYDQSTKTAWEYKVVRLPRNKNHALYDIGQLGYDYMRVSRRATRLSGGYLVILLYGPLVEDAKSSQGVYRHFHDQCYLERFRCIDQNRRIGSQRDKALRQMGFAQTAKNLPDHVVVARHHCGDLAAIAFDCWS